MGKIIQNFSLVRCFSHTGIYFKKAKIQDYYYKDGHEYNFYEILLIIG